MIPSARCTGFDEKLTGSAYPAKSNIRLANIKVFEERLSTFRFLSNMRRNYLGALDREVFQELIVERHYLWFHTFLVSNPEGVRRILVDKSSNYVKAELTYGILKPVLGDGLLTSEGEHWRRHRRIMAPVFDARVIPQYSDTFTRVILNHLDYWNSQPNGAEIDICTEMMRLTLEIISQAMFSRDSGDLGKLIAAKSAEYLPAMTFSMWGTLPVTRKAWANRRKLLARKLLGELDDAIYTLIAQRQQLQPAQRANDLLDHLLRAQDEQGGSVLTNSELRDEVMTIFVAGHETTALALTWIWYVLSQCPHEQAKVLDEIRNVVTNRFPTYGEVSSLTYTRMVIDEVLRLYPPIHTLGWRQALHDDEICGRRIPKGAFVLVVPWVLHRHVKLWDKPEEFNPGRFSKQHQAMRSKYSYIPFSYGPHVCIGASFAMTEILFALAILLPRYQLVLVDESSVKPRGMVTLHPDGGMKMYLHKRAR